MKKYLRYIGLLVFIILPLLWPSPVFAATQNRAVAGEGTQNFGVGFYVYNGGAADYTVLNSNDGDTSYWEGTTAGGAARHHTWDMVAFATAGEITNVRLAVKARDSSAVNTCLLTPCAKVSGSNYYGTQVTTADTYTTYVADWAVNPSTGTGWTTAQLNAAEFGIRGQTGAGVSIYMTYMYIIVTYTPASAPSVTTDAADTITGTGADLNGTITDDGTQTIDYYGFVWDTADQGDPGNADPSGPPGAWSNGWKSGVGDYGETSQEHTIGGLANGTEYFFRFAAHNASGWTYGTALSFTTIGNPSITTIAASNVVATTARLNALVVDDGGEACTIDFAWGTTAGGPYANFAAFPNNDTVAGTWTTGGYPYLNIAGLATSTDYTFMCAITNSVSTQYGAQLTFETESGIYEPTNMKAYINDENSISLQWTKGIGSTNTLVRWKLNSYPQNITDGSLLYFDEASSVEHTGLSPGTTYYYSAWGESGGVYSTDNTTVFATTLAYVSNDPDLNAPSTPSEWFQTPDYTNMANFPFYGWVNWIADAWDLPYNTMWAFAALGFIVIVGIVVYRISNKLPVMLLTIGIGIVVISIAGLTPLWLILPGAVLIISFWAVGERA